MAGHLRYQLKQQKPFRSLEAEVFLNVLRTATTFVGQLVEVLRPYELTQPQYNVLRILRGAGGAGLPSGEVGVRMVSREPDVTRLLDRMEQRGLVERLARPDRHHLPTCRLERSGILAVALGVAIELRVPVAGVRSRPATVRAALGLMPMPEAAVDEDHFPTAGEGDVGLAGQVLQVDAVAIAERVKQPAHAQLGFEQLRAVEIPVTDLQRPGRRRVERQPRRPRVEAAGFDVLRATSFVTFLLPAMLIARRRSGDGMAEVEAELDLPPFANAIGSATLALERALIRCGVDLPAGGSLLVVAQRRD